MPSCELCGKDLETIRKAKIENSILLVCSNCIKFGEEVQFHVSQNAQQGTKQISKSFESPFPEYEIVENYATLVKNARERKGMKQEEFAKFLQERLSLLRKIESGKHKPDIELAKKLEKKLGIKLFALSDF